MMNYKELKASLTKDFDDALENHRKNLKELTKKHAKLFLDNIDKSSDILQQTIFDEIVEYVQDDDMRMICECIDEVIEEKKKEKEKEKEKMIEQIKQKLTKEEFDFITKS